jgi:hypothetical protein
MAPAAPEMAGQSLTRVTPTVMGVPTAGWAFLHEGRDSYSHSVRNVPAVSQPNASRPAGIRLICRDRYSIMKNWSRTATGPPRPQRPE